jgi:hypothetical protein
VGGQLHTPVAVSPEKEPQNTHGIRGWAGSRTDVDISEKINVRELNHDFLVVQSLSGAAVAQLVEALHYKPEGHGFDSRWCHWNFSFA